MQQEQDEEVLKAALQEISQIKAELAKQKTELVKEKTFSIPLIVLSTTITGIVFPLILWAIENFFTNHKWPLVIQITTGGQIIPTTYIFISLIGAFILIDWVIYRILNPFKCTCGYRTWFLRKMMKHLFPHSTVYGEKNRIVNTQEQADEEPAGEAVVAPKPGFANVNQCGYARDQCLRSIEKSSAS